ncbi:carnitine 3-dehydrogenase [Ponticoccus litoralis]|uniref:L-carnitine dehydrogenase n=1 Tax=Ponticoccus litoralis TaxID=422297 RepID=A0AAW9SPD5_9RHOB
MRKLACVIGGGVIGGGWVARFALMGWEVRVFDPDPRAAERIGAVVKGAERALPMLFESPMPKPGGVSYHATLAEAVQGASYIQESVPEDLDLKVKVFQEVQCHCSCDAVIASSTSGFRPSQLREGLERPGQLVVAHPFNPVYLLPLVELVQGANADPYFTDKAEEILTGIGMYPLRIRSEIDAHIADRLLEAVWREALWLVKDGLATTQEIDDSIRYGFGLRWAQMGLFETYRIAGGEAGMAHFLEKFGPALKWPWSRLTEVPDLDADLVKTIADQSDAQSGNRGIRDLERLRDDNLVAILRALKGQGAAAGKLLKEQDDRLRRPLGDGVPLVTVRRKVPVDWTDSNGHMNEGRYGQVFSDASEALMAHVGADQAYIAAGNSYFTAETNIRYRAETLAGEDIVVETRVALGAGKKLRLLHEMKGANGDLRATCDQFLLHVSLQTRRSCPPLPDVRQRIEALASLHDRAR